jgi:hypothetical protein
LRWLDYFENSHHLGKTKRAQQGVQPIWGMRRVFKRYSWL